ncbi:MAG TPA: DivIVA domain-containing protein [Solirubrobacteraceae bacterium]|nr:DivIVA domain-containing protein [Solirubrobacteraceae bacterium]
MRHQPNSDAASLREAAFSTVLMGYDRLQVDAYVDRVREYVAANQVPPTPEGAVQDALERVGEETSAVLQRANEVGRDITARAQAEADLHLRKADTQARSLVAAAETQVRELDGEIRSLWEERARLLGDMRRIAEQLVQLAEAANQRFPDDHPPVTRPSAPDPTTPTPEVTQAMPAVAAGDEDGPGSAGHDRARVDLAAAGLGNAEAVERRLVHEDDADEDELDDEAFDEAFGIGEPWEDESDGPEADRQHAPQEIQTTRALPPLQLAHHTRRVPARDREGF